MADWSGAQIELLRKYWNEGLSATHIIAKLDYVFSRSAILGKVNRLNLKPRRAAYGKGEIRERQPHHKPSPPKPIGNTKSKPLPPTPAPPPVKELKPPTVEPVRAEPVKPRRGRNRLPRVFNDNVFFANWISNLSPRPRDIYRIPRDKHCKFIIGEVANPTSYWCNEITDGGSWCTYHRDIVFQPLDQRYRRRKTK